MSDRVDRLRPYFRDALEQLLGAWVPRMLDTRYGGYLCDFDFKWRNRGENLKMLEFQSRSLRCLSRAAIVKPHLLDAAETGFRFLADTMWDSENGGFYRMTDRSGKPLEDGRKHGHGTAYAISACAWYFRATGSKEARELGVRAFEWLDAHAHDESDGGYFSFMQRDGSLIRSPDEVAGESGFRDPLGNPIGYKDANTTVDLLEAMADLYTESPSPALQGRLRELLDIVLEHIVVSPGVLHLVLTPDWKPIPYITSYDQCMQAGFLIARADAALNGGKPGQAVLEQSREIAEAVHAAAWDERVGGYCQGGWAFGRTALAGYPVYVPTKTWWGQAEALRLLVALDAAYPDGEYGARAEKLWNYIDRYVIDKRYGGWHRRGMDCEGADAKSPKATIWKDPCHEGFALLEVSETTGP